MEVDERREATLIHDDRRCKNNEQLFIMNFEGAESPMCIVCFCVLVCFVCLQVYGVWSLQFNGDGFLSWLWWWKEFTAATGVALEWAMQIMLCMTGWCWEDDGAERKRDGYKSRSWSHQRQLSFPFRIDVKQQKYVLECSWTEKEECLSILCFLLAWSYLFLLRCSLLENRRLIYVRCRD
jgi:hypothetical protein